MIVLVLRTLTKDLVVLKGSLVLVALKIFLVVSLVVVHLLEEMDQQEEEILNKKYQLHLKKHAMA